MREHLRGILRELERVGLKARLDDTGSGHVRVSWAISGKPQSIITSRTPSDHRTALNDRANVR